MDKEQTDTKAAATSTTGGLTENDLSALIASVTEKTMAEAQRIADAKIDAFKTELASKTTPMPFTTTAGTPTPTQVSFKAAHDDKNKLGAIMHAMGAASLNRKSLEEGFKIIGKDMSMFMATEKSMTMAESGDGGYLVNEQFSTEIIPLLYNATVVRKAGCPVLNVPAGNMTFPIGSTGSTGYYRGETAQKKTSKLTFVQGNMSVKNAVVAVPVSDKLLRYSSYNLSEYIQNDMITRLALLEDSSYLTGIGTNYTPKGLTLWTPSANQVSMTSNPDATKIRKDLLALPKKLAANNVPKIKPAWFMDSTVYYHLISQVDPTTYQPLDYARTLSAENPTLFGAPVYVTNTLSGTGYVIYGDLGYCLVGMGMDVRLKFTEGGSYLDSDNTTVVSGQVTGESVFEVELEHDFFVKQPLALSMLTGVTWGS